MFFVKIQKREVGLPPVSGCIIYIAMYGKSILHFEFSYHGEFQKYLFFSCSKMKVSHFRLPQQSPLSCLHNQIRYSISS